jgi:threonine synthase
VSTRGGVPSASLSDALFAGPAADGGLYVPERVPRLEPQAFAGLDDLAAVAARVLGPFAEGDPLAAELAKLAAEAFTFEAPLRALAAPDTYVLELFHGPTAAFKDFGARFLAACFRRLARRSAHQLTVLVATSGDTGSAVGAAFHGMQGVRVVILYPDGRVSPRQAHQLGCFGDNVHALAVQGTFDDCQRLAKQAFADADLRERAPLVSANSISLGRLLPQMSYYAHAALTHWRAHAEPLHFAVPTGNLGNAFACTLARAAGLPIGDVLLACNANRVIPDYLAAGSYQPRPSLATLANAMDVGDPSNLERLRWLHAEPGRAGISAESVDDTTITARIAESERRYGATFCPHTACAAEALEHRRRAGDARAWCIVATAHPAKFEGIVEPLVDHAVPAPPALAAMLARPSRSERLGAEYMGLRAWLLRR